MLQLLQLQTLTNNAKNSSHNNHDFKTTSSSVKLQTDLFDNNEELADFEAKFLLFD